MSKLSNLTSGKSITPGMQIVTVISTEDPNSKAALVLKSIARICKGVRISREFPDQWGDESGVAVKKGSVIFNGRTFDLSVKIGTKEGLVLVDGHGLSMKANEKDGFTVLQVEKLILPARIDSFANELVGCWVVHGEDWINRKAQRIHRPYGLQKMNISDKLYFRVVDGAKEPKITLKELISLGCIRSTHAGEWKARHSTLIAALCDMPLLLHEFKEEGTDICSFNGFVIGNEPTRWGPYCGWNESVRRSGQLGIWTDLACACASPFAFHVHATRALFPAANLDSTTLLESIGKEKLEGILDLIAREDPERFYRLIDENGVTWRLNRVEKDCIWYGNDRKVSRHSIASNVIDTFCHLQLLQADPGHLIPRAVRVVPDTHFYLVLEALAARKKSVYALSGRDMHRYLTDDLSANMHCVRNERLFLLLRGLFGVSSIDFYVYPPLSISSGLVSQYGPL